jgi:beta-galactosidase/beta-glucuronidase
MENRRSQVYLDGAWRFNIDRRETGETSGWNNPSYPDEHWNEFPVPGSWDSYLPELFGYGGMCWYRRSFSIRPTWKGRKIHLRFEGANYATTVWLNGQLVGSHMGGFDPFEFDVTGMVNWDAANHLAVKVDNWPKINRVPNSLAGWWNYGGIFRSVILEALPEVRINDIFVHSSEVVDGKPLMVSLELINESDRAVEVILSGKLRGFDSIAGMTAPGSVRLEPGTKSVVELTAQLDNANLWSPQTPDLYTLQLDLFSGRKLLDRTGLRFGVRKFEVRGKQLFLNNQPIYLTGFDRHEEYFGTGRVDTENQLVEDLAWIQRMGGNMVRMHYQAHPDLYDLADEMGLLVFAEIPAWQIGIKDPKEWENEEVWQITESMLRTLIHDLKNHPSVVIWSVGNECATQLQESRPLIKHLADIARALDTSRPVAMVGMYGENDLFYDLVDLPCMNTYSGHDQAGLRTRIEKILAKVGDKPLLVTEFGAEAMLELHGDNYGTEDEQASIIADHWQVFQEFRDSIPGALIWSLADYWHMPMSPDFSWGVNRYYFCHGVLTLDRFPKKAVETAGRLFQSIAREA